jgi:alpha-1,3-mannosyltransferase
LPVLFDFNLSSVISYVFSLLDTEIDWKAYMEEVEGYLNGERDYRLIQGSTGPLVYPAGFVYIFTGLRYLTNNGTDIFKAQNIFLFIYIINLAVVLILYRKAGKIPLVVCGLLVLTKRIHSIFLLRMFNDCIAVLLGHIAILFFSQHRWSFGSVFYSLAVSVKMNMLLYAPGVFIVMLLAEGLSKTIQYIFLCGIVQILLGFPFLTTYPISYLTKAFELNRVFFYEWTVNFKFLSEEIFLSKPLAIGLLLLTIIGKISRFFCF